MFSDGLDSVESSLPDVSILLVAELLLEGFDGPVNNIVSKKSLVRIATGSPAMREIKDKIEENCAQNKGKETAIMTGL
jgi:hypothetical protein